MRTTIEQLSDSDIIEANVVTLVDPSSPTYSKQLYGQDSVPPLSHPDAPARRVNVLEVEIDSSDDSQLQNMLDKVETVKGRLPQDALRLRKAK